MDAVVDGHSARREQSGRLRRHRTSNDLTAFRGGGRGRGFVRAAPLGGARTKPRSGGYQQRAGKFCYCAPELRGRMGVNLRYALLSPGDNIHRISLFT